MNVYDALKTRKSTRAFLSTEISPDMINKILDGARHTPSGVNTQPWNVAVVSGVAKRSLQNKIEAAFRNNAPKNMEYNYYPELWNEPFKSRRKACGLQLYKTLGITKEDKEKSIDQWAANYRAFDAPVMLFFFIDKSLDKGSYLDYGMFIQSVMLMATSEGLATCPQAALGEYPDIIKSELNYSNDYTLLCGMALGYEDSTAIVNSYRTPREEVQAFTQFFS